MLTLIPLVELSCLWGHEGHDTHVFLTLAHLTAL